MSTLLDDVSYLAGTIGPRGTGTIAESAAADFVFCRLASLGLSPGKFSFRSVPSQNAFPFATSLMVLLAVMISPLNGTITRWLASILSLVAAWFLWQTIRSAFIPLSLILPKVTEEIDDSPSYFGNPKEFFFEEKA